MAYKIIENHDGIATIQQQQPVFQIPQGLQGLPFGIVDNQNPA